LGPGLDPAEPASISTEFSWPLCCATRFSRRRASVRARSNISVDDFDSRWALTPSRRPGPVRQHLTRSSFSVLASAPTGFGPIRRAPVRFPPAVSSCFPRCKSAPACSHGLCARSCSKVSPSVLSPPPRSHSSFWSEIGKAHWPILRRCRVLVIFGFVFLLFRVRRSFS
jgi:hypothetical protein